MRLVAALSRLSKVLRTRRYVSKFRHLGRKQQTEIAFWIKVIDKYVEWYNGRLPHLYGKPPPLAQNKVDRFDQRSNAIWTWINAVKYKYLEALKVEDHYFEGRSVLDIGCGPLPHLQCFKSIKRYGLDQLIDAYRLIGFPLDEYDPPIKYIKGSAESIPAEDNSFDAIISVNAIDHVDNFPAAASEIRRVLRDGGILRMQVHYHKRTISEPWELNDHLIWEHFGTLDISKIHEQPGPRRDRELDKLVVWSTHE